jgi:hypothetical protein
MKDFANNKLMERMNSELDLRVHGVDRNTIERPFLNEDSDDEIDFTKIKKFKKHGIPNDDFTSKRMLGRRHDI